MCLTENHMKLPKLAPRPIGYNTSVILVIIEGNIRGGMVIIFIRNNLRNTIA
jgi:hypothetical protein